MAYNNPRTQISAKKKGSSGALRGIIGAMLGGSGMTGGGYTPAIDPSAEVLGEFNRTGGAPMVDGNVDEDASIDKWNATAEEASDIFGGLSAKPGGFERAKVNNPWIDIIFNQGAGAQQALAINQQQGLAQASMDANSAAAKAANEASFQRQQMADEASAARQIEMDKEAMRRAELSVDAPSLQAGRIPVSARGDWSSRVSTPSVGFAGNVADARFKASQDPRFANEVSNNVVAEQRALPVDVQARSRMTVPMDTDIYQAGMGYDQPNVVAKGRSRSQNLVSTGGFPMKMPDGSTVMVGAKQEVLTSEKPGSMMEVPNEYQRADKEERVKQELEMLKQKSAMEVPPSEGPVGPPNLSAKGTSPVSPGNVGPAFQRNIIDWIIKQYMKSAPGTR